MFLSWLSTCRFPDVIAFVLKLAVTMPMMLAVMVIFALRVVIVQMSVFELKLMALNELFLKFT